MCCECAQSAQQTEEKEKKKKLKIDADTFWITLQRSSSNIFSLSSGRVHVIASEELLFICFYHIFMVFVVWKRIRKKEKKKKIFWKQIENKRKNFKWEKQVSSAITQETRRKNIYRNISISFVDWLRSHSQSIDSSKKSTETHRHTHTHTSVANVSEIHFAEQMGIHHSCLMWWMFNARGTSIGLCVRVRQNFMDSIEMTMSWAHTQFVVTELNSLSRSLLVVELAQCALETYTHLSGFDWWRVQCASASMHGNGCRANVNQNDIGKNAP